MIDAGLITTEEVDQRLDAARFSHLALVVRDMELQADFYCAALGFRRGEEYVSSGHRVAALMESAPSGMQGVFLRLGDFLLELLAYVEPEPGSLPRPAAAPGLAHISLVVPDVAAAVTATQSAGGALRQRFAHSFTPGGTATTIAFCVDPEGNRIEFIEHPNDGETAGHAAFLGLTDLGWPAAAPGSP